MSGSKIFVGLTPLLAAFGLAAAAQAPTPAPLAEQVTAAIQARLPASARDPRLRSGESRHPSPWVPCFYRDRGFRPAWIGDDGAPAPAAGELVAAIAGAGAEGLLPEDYHASELRLRLEEITERREPAALADLDVLLSDAFLSYASHLRAGRVDPAALARDCTSAPGEEDLAAALEAALASGRVWEPLMDLAPRHPGYVRLRQALARMRQAAADGGWPAIPATETLREGDTGAAVAELRARLEASGEAAPPLPEARELFDPELAAAVQAFQARHGLVVDGIVGRATRGALAVTAEARVQQLAINLERWRWLPRDLGRRYVMVNAAGFALTAVEDGGTKLAMRVIVGKAATRTPSFSSEMQSVVVNPSWHVPASIARNEVLPRRARDPAWFAREGFRILPGGAVVQPPGPQNALGRIKFLFPNRFGVYLHDTPAKSLFARETRIFSHGCMRVEKPLDLAEWALSGDPAWSRQAIEAAIAAGRERTVAVPEPIAVHVVYLTAWVDDEGALQLRDDVYARDRGLLEVFFP